MCIIIQRCIVNIFIVVFFTTFCNAQTPFIVGRLVDESTLQAISRSTILIRESGFKTESDNEGYFRLPFRSNVIQTLSIHHLAYMEVERIVVRSAIDIDTITIELRQRIFQSDGLVIQSTRTFGSAARSPFPVNVIPQEEISRNNAVSVSDILSRSPGSVLVRDGAWSTAISIRGMSRSNIVTLIDNVRIETANDIAGSMSLINPNDLDRVESVRSSGSALFGSGAFGGVVQLITKRPSFTDDVRWDGEFTAGYSGVNDCASQFISVQGSSERIAGRFSGGYRNAQNTVTPAGMIPNSQFTDFSFNGSIGIRIFENQTLLARYQRSQGERIGISGGDPFSVTAIATYRHIHRELFGIDYSIPDISAVVPFINFRLSQQNIVRNVEIIQSPTLTLTPHAIHSTSSVQVESKLNIPESHQCVFGAELWQRTLDSRRERIDANSGTITGERPVPHARFLSAGFYGQNEWQLIQEKITLVFGVRYDRIYIGNDETKNPDYIISNNRINTTPPQQHMLWSSGTAVNDSWSATTGIQYGVQRNLGLVLLVSTAFRSPSLEERFQYLTLGNGIHVGNRNLKPEQSTGINAGMYWHHSRSTLRADFFLNQLTNLVAEIPGVFDGSPAMIKANIDRARLYGYEISVVYSVAPWSTVRCAVSSVRGEDIQRNTNLREIAPLHGSIELDLYHHSAGSITVTSTVYAAQTRIADGESTTAGYGLFDLTAASLPVSIGRVTMTMHGGVHNVLNTSYRHHLSTIRGTPSAEPGRNFFLSVSCIVS